jgi:hypothetical protein
MYVCMYVYIYTCNVQHAYDINILHNIYIYVKLYIITFIRMHNNYMYIYISVKNWEHHGKARTSVDCTDCLIKTDAWSIEVDGHC